MQASIDCISVRVWGRAKPSGSHRSYGKGITFADPKTRDWMQEVRSAAADAMRGRGLIEGPVQLGCRFHFARPKKHYRTGKYSHLLREDAPTYMSKTPDLSKLVRAVEDAMTKTVWVDDQQVVEYVDVRKSWSSDGREWVDVTVSQLLE